ncbi:hypothetical protein U1Q18_044407 [Sarracenia purpurea var. burkii]
MRRRRRQNGRHWFTTNGGGGSVYIGSLPTNEEEDLLVANGGGDSVYTGSLPLVVRRLGDHRGSKREGPQPKSREEDKELISFF